MATTEQSAVNIKHMHVQEVKHTMKAARLLYSAPDFILRGPIYMIFVICVGGLAYSFWGVVPSTVTCQLELRRTVTSVQAHAGGIVQRIYVSEGSTFATLTNLVDIQFRTDVNQSSARDDLDEQLTKLEDRRKDIKEGGVITKKKIADLEQQKAAERAKIPKLDEEFAREDASFVKEFDDHKSRLARLAINLEQSKRETKRLADLLKSHQEQLTADRELLTKEEDLMKKQLTTVDAVNGRKAQVRQSEQIVIQSQAQIDLNSKEIDKGEQDMREEKGQPERIENRQKTAKLSREARKNQILLNISSTDTAIDSERHGERKSLEEIDRDIERTKERLKEAGTLVSTFKIEGNTGKVTSSFGGLVVGVHVKPGQQISAGETMLSVIKETDMPYAKVLVANHDIGRIKKDQEVRIKYEAYPYQEYDVQVGKIQNIPETPSTLPGQESFYEVKVQLTDIGNIPGEKSRRFNSTHINVGSTQDKDRENWRKLTLGLRGLADIKTGEKKLIEVVFAPISKFFGSDD